MAGVSGHIQKRSTDTLSMSPLKGIITISMYPGVCIPVLASDIILKNHSN